MNLMPTSKTKRISLISVCFLGLLCAVSAAAQVTLNQEPEPQQLLNGLRILLWQRPGDKDLLIKLRIHSGAAFDLSGKAGEIASLETFISRPATREYFTEEMGGLEVDTDYDSITVTSKGGPSR